MLEHGPKQYAKQTVLYSGAVICANFLQWVFSFVARRLTGNETFAIIGVFSSLSSLFGLFAGTISQSLERYLPYYVSAGSFGHAHQFKRAFARISVGVGLSITVFTLIAYEVIARFMAIEPAVLVLLFAPSLFIFFLLAYLRGVLKSFLRFDVIGVMMIVEGLVKTLVLGVAVYFHIPLLWIAALSITISLASSLVFGYVVLRMLGYEKHLKLKASSEKVQLPKREVAFYAANAFFDDIGLGLLLNIDVLLVNKFFSGFETGIYATLSFFGKILFLSGSMIGPLILPITASVLGKGKSSIKTFGWLLAGVGIAGGSVVVAFAVLPDFFIHFFGGERAVVVRPYLALYFLGMWSLLMARSFSSYYQAKKDFVISRVMIAGAFVLMGCIILWHNSLMQVVYSLAAVAVGLLVFSMFYFIRDVFYRTPSQGELSFSGGQLVRLCWLYVVSVFSLQRRNIRFTFPETLFESSLERILTEPTDAKPVALALYRTQTGQKFFVKAWCGSKDDFYKLSLEQEAMFYTALDGAELSLPDEGLTLAVPKLVTYRAENNVLVLTRKYVSAPVLSSVQNSAERNRVLWTVLANFKQFGSVVSPEHFQQFPVLRSWVAVLSFPLFVLANMRSSHGYKGLVVRAIVQYAQLTFKVLPHIFQTSNHVLVHRDLHVENILFDGQRVEVIDIGECVVASPVVEYVYAITAGSMASEEEYMGAIQKVGKEILQGKNQQLFLLFLLIRCVGLLSEPHIPHGQAQKFSRIIRCIREIA